MSKIVVTWSIAYDSLMTVDNEFQNIILPEQLSNLNVWFLATDMKKSLGGTATNIAYSLWLLWMKDETIMLGVVWKDFSVDEKSSRYVDFSHILTIEDDFTACAYVTTDRKENQITAFYPWVMNQADKMSLAEIDDVDYCIVSPNGKAAMLKFVQEAKDKGINCFFDPGQQLPTFTKDELISCCVSANYLICNAYEFDLLMKMTERDQFQLLKYFEKIIVTLGAVWVRLIEEGREVLIPWILVPNVVDPTGCGDALRSWLLYGLTNDKTWEESLKIGTIVASYVVRKKWTIEHLFTWGDIQNILDTPSNIS